MLGWLDAHAGAIQALGVVAMLIVTVTLARLTARYVRLTKSIADSSVEQARILRDSLADARTRARGSLVALSRRLLSSVSILAENGPHHTQLHVYALMSEEDALSLESLAKEVGGGAQENAAAAATALRHLLGWINRGAKTAPILGWNLRPDEAAEYVRARRDGIEALTALSRGSEVPQ